MPIVLPPSDLEPILTFNRTGRFAVWLEDGSGPRGALLGVTEARVGHVSIAREVEVSEERWAVLINDQTASDKVAPIPAGLAPRWGKDVSSKRLYVDGVEDSDVTDFPAEFGENDQTWSGSEADFLDLAVAWLKKHSGSDQVQRKHLMLFHGTTILSPVSENPPDWSENLVDNKASKRVFDVKLGRSGPDRGWLYQELPEFEQGEAKRMVFHLLAHPEELLPKRGELSQCSKDSMDGQLELKELFQRALGDDAMTNKDGVLAWYRTAVTVTMGRDV